MKLNELDEDEFAQVAENMENDMVGKLAQEYSDEEEIEFAQDSEDEDVGLAQTESGIEAAINQGVTNGMMDDVADFFMQTEADSRESLGQTLLQTKATADDFMANMTPETRQQFDNMYAQVRQSGYSWLSQIGDYPRARLGEMLSQTSYGNYFMQQNVREDVAEEIGNYFSQFEAVPYDE
mmetsp:Transcript_43902/g.58213  ORF Transcript_43902/g.58213 Transcript_43902/m.58213 type:complete len:180 (-) Transcript_43902:275-814(-)